MDKYQYFNGLKFTRDDKTGYYLNSTIRKRMHRYVWEFFNGEIPKEYDIHHKDGNKSNNDISNLEMLAKSEHRKYHSEHLTDECKAKLRDNMNQKARPAAIMWHKSAAGNEWHKRHYEQSKDKMHQKYWIACETCNTVFEGYKNSRFCSNACKSAYRRREGLDNTCKECPICGKIFLTNKYRNAETCRRSCANVMKARRRNESKICTEA